MKIAVYSAKEYEIDFFNRYNKHGFILHFFEARLNSDTVKLSEGFDAVCIFVNDELNRAVLKSLADYGIRLVALRCAGYNNVDIVAADEYKISVVRVPAYSPYAVAEHTVALIMSLNRKIFKAHNRVREGNFALNGLMGFDMFGKTVGIIGTGKIGFITGKILSGFGCNILVYDLFRNSECEKLGMKYVELTELFAKSDIISLHCPLTPETHHLICRKNIENMKHGVMIVNTSRGALINTVDVIDGLKKEIIGYLGLDVYEEEADLFFEDLSAQVIQDDIFARLLTFPNVLITGHQAFFTATAMKNIIQTTFDNIKKFELGECSVNAVCCSLFKK